MYTWDSSVIKLTIKLFNALTDTCEPLMVAVAYIFLSPYYSERVFLCFPGFSPSSVSRVAGSRLRCYSTYLVVCNIFKILFLLLFMCMRTCLCRCVRYGGGDPRGLEDNVRCPGTGAMGYCEPLDVCAGNQALLLDMSSEDS